MKKRSGSSSLATAKKDLKTNVDGDKPHPLATLTTAKDPNGQRWWVWMDEKGIANALPASPSASIPEVLVDAVVQVMKSPRPARRSPSVRRNKPDRRYHVQRQHGDQHGERRQVSQEVFLDRVKESCKTRIADAEKEFDKRLDSLGEDARTSVVLPACQKHGLEFFSGNGDFWFEKDGERLDRTEPHGAPGRVAMVKMGLESVFAVLELEIVGGDFLGFHVASVDKEDLRKEALRTMSRKVGSQ